MSRRSLHICLASSSDVDQDKAQPCIAFALQKFRLQPSSWHVSSRNLRAFDKRRYCRAQQFDECRKTLRIVVCKVGHSCSAHLLPCGAWPPQQLRLVHS